MAVHHLIVGLGNPGKEYVGTRHNVGFEVVSLFARKNDFVLKRSLAMLGKLARKETTLLLLPATYMNESGQAVRRCIDYYEVALEQMIVVCDDAALPVGTLRLRTKGSSGGHNGLKSIQSHVGTEHYARLRVGIGSSTHGDLSSYVLGKFTEEEQPLIEQVVTQAVDVLEIWLTEGMAAAMHAAHDKNGDKING